MNLIDRLILREVLKTLSLIIVILLVVLFANQMVKLLGKIATGALSGDILLSLTGYQMIRLLPRLLPAAFFFALLWVLASMYRDNEMTALYSSGVSLARIYRAALTSALPVCILTAAFSLYWVPWANAGIQQIQQQPQALDKISLIRPAEFNEYGEVIVYAAALSADGTRLQQLFLQDQQQGKTGIVMADNAYIRTEPETGERYLILQQGHRYAGKPGQTDYQISTFAEYGLRIPVADPTPVRLQIAAQPSSELWQQDQLAARAEWQYRLSLPLAVLIFTLLAVPLARTAPRQDIYGRIVLAILIYFVYLNLQRVAERWMEQAITPAWLGLWWVAAGLAAIAGLLLCFDTAWMTRRLRTWRTRRVSV
ncbi:MAG: LPS export ABC transporter permease LptF [Pseudomonadota bacterium]